MTIHHLKQAEEVFEAALNDSKTFEIRENNRNYQVNDILVLEEWNGTSFTGRRTSKRITYILSDTKYGMKEGYVILATKSLHRRYS